MDRTRWLIVTADDFGISPLTSRGILDLAARGRVTCAALLVTSPDAAASVAAWRSAAMPMELGWHPCLTLDRPVSAPRDVRSLVDGEGRFLSLRRFLFRLAAGRVDREDLRRELQAQLQRFIELVGAPPVSVNAHHHVQTFPPVGQVLVEVLSRGGGRPYVRRVREPWSTLVGVPGARAKRALLTFFGTIEANRLDRLGWPGNEWLAGVTDCASVADPEFFARWLSAVPGRVVELVCHPGEHDPELEGRDGSARDGSLQRRANELRLLEHDGFAAACARARFTLAAPSELARKRPTGGRHAA
jgi:predicted glycoside hydrolase/deacetylase ChbG (UPF0249 family)